MMNFAPDGRRPDGIDWNDILRSAAFGAAVGGLTSIFDSWARNTAPDGTAVVPVYTSPRYLRAAGPFGFAQLPVADLLARIPPGHDLCLNSSAPVSMVLPTTGLAEALKNTRPEEPPGTAG
ncbi:SseB family protein [Streptomyces sp. DH24]|uniref:SseB family protein n=1 Tax=Streptomyces sp. DH24 TaxID=3040123 RepID=UPI003015657A